MRTIKSMMGLFLVLAIQLFQVQSSLASIAASSCVSEAKSSCCCSGEERCPCVKSAPEKETKAPLSPVSSETKAPEFIEPSSGVLTQDFQVNPFSEVRSPMSCGRLPIGYHGVPLSVAFCRFVI